MKHQIGSLLVASALSLGGLGGAGVLEVLGAAPASADELTIIGMGIHGDGSIIVLYSDGTVELWPPQA